jgi:hypothetical protein
MAVNSDIGGNGTLFIGEDKVFKLELLDANNVPVDMTGMALLFDIRLKDTSSDPAIVSKTPALIGVYNVVRAVNTQRAQAVLSDTDMNLFRAKAYRHSWKRMDDGVETVLAYGFFTPQKATAP